MHDQHLTQQYQMRNSKHPLMMSATNMQMSSHLNGLNSENTRHLLLAQGSYDRHTSLQSDVKNTKGFNFFILLFTQ
jgi:hypothetical protein